LGTRRSLEWGRIYRVNSKIKNSIDNEMAMKSSIYARCIFWFLFATGLIIGMGLRVIWGYGGPAWTYGLGDTVMGITIAFAGVNLIAGLMLNPQFVYKLRSKKSDRSEIRLREKIIWFLIGGVLTLWGVLILSRSVFLLVKGYVDYP
jgi:hypothetical protein